MEIIQYGYEAKNHQNKSSEGCVRYYDADKLSQADAKRILSPRKG